MTAQVSVYFKHYLSLGLGLLHAMVSRPSKCGESEA